MEKVNISFDLVGHPLGEDIYSEQGILLLKKGIILKEIHILLLQRYRFGTKVAVDLDTLSSTFHWKKSPSVEPYKSFHSFVKNTFEALLIDKNIDLTPLKKRYHKLIDLSLCDLSILKVLKSEVETEEKFYQHCINVGIFSAIMGKLLGYNRKDCLLLAEMGLFHDIGMIRLTDDVNSMDFGQNDDDLKRIQEHTEMGYQLLKSIPDLEPIVPIAALYHHERLNGSGYPSQLKEKDIPLFIQIISTADYFNRMRMKHRTSEKDSLVLGAYELVDAAHNHLLNPGIVTPFVKYIMRQNLLEKVTLNNGEEAQILFIHENEPHQPLIKIHDEYFDLRKDSSIRIKGVAGSEDFKELIH
ncbi:HD domain-containing protein [Bacillus sp. Bva_UNVM-123]|uniref:HD-GYP domain-containing protein n=1 Tax=Bacillus sp. Bva_UNVM-123 TaxID=2829798 RepID=UPI00391F5F12